MIFSTQNEVLVSRFGEIKACDMLMDAGYKAIDFTFYDEKRAFALKDGYKELAKELRLRADSRGVIFNQGHAPFGGGFDHYTKETVPKFPRIFETFQLLGVKQAVVHPVQIRPYFGREKEIFDYNVKFFKDLSPIAKEYGVKIAIENMWMRHPISNKIIDDICANPQELADLYDALDDEKAFTICLDVGHIPLCGREPANAIKLLGHDRLGALHVHDVDYITDCHTLPGMEKINWDSVCRALGEIDYKGEFTLEADNFLINYSDDFLPTAVRFMADVAKHLSDKVDEYRIK